MQNENNFLRKLLIQFSLKDNFETSFCGVVICLRLAVKREIFLLPLEIRLFLKRLRVTRLDVQLRPQLPNELLVLAWLFL